MPHPLKYPYNQHGIPRKVQGLLRRAASSPGNLWDNSKRSSEDINLAASLAPRKPADLPPFRTGPGIFILLPKISGLRSLSGEAACSPAQRRWLCNNASAGQAAQGSEGTCAALPGPMAHERQVAAAELSLPWLLRGGRGTTVFQGAARDESPGPLHLPPSHKPHISLPPSQLLFLFT